MTTLSWKQVAAWRLSHQSLLERAPATEALAVVQNLGALHAQLMSAAELSLAARVENLPSAFVEDALWKKRTLIKTWAIRGTLHLLAAEDFPLFIGAFRAFEHWRKPSWLKYNDVTLKELNTLIEGVYTTLTDKGMTRTALAEALVKHTGKAAIAERLLSGWGMLLKPAAFQGYLAFAPNEGQNVTFTRPDLWLKKGVYTAIAPDTETDEQPPEKKGKQDASLPLKAEEAFQEILRRYLTAFGPATPEDFARWWGLQPAPAKKIFKAAGDAITKVKVEGWEAYLPTAALERLKTLLAPKGVRLLPFFDPYVVALPRSNSHFLPDAYRSAVYRTQGWISPVVLVDGHIVGVWEQDKKRDHTLLTVTPFTALKKPIQKAIAQEAERFATFTESEIEVVYADEG